MAEVGEDRQVLLGAGERGDCKHADQKAGDEAWIDPAHALFGKVAQLGFGHPTRSDKAPAQHEEGVNRKGVHVERSAKSESRIKMKITCFEHQCVADDNEGGEREAEQIEMIVSAGAIFVRN